MLHDNLAVSPTWIIYVYSRHPLAHQTIMKGLDSLHHNVQCLSEVPSEDLLIRNSLLVVDTCSEEKWLELTMRAGLRQGRPVILLVENVGTPDDEIRLVYLGVRGIVPISNMENELSMAAKAVIDGNLWFRRNTLTECMMRMGPAKGNSAGRFTAREEQIVSCLIGGLSNKEIAEHITISDRTVKFHVANILRKFKVKNRRELFKTPEVHILRSKPHGFR